MKLLLDSCIWVGTCRDLAALGHDVSWVGDWQADPGDEEILARAYREDRVLITLDKDFGELAVALKKPHAGILRLVSTNPRQQAALCVPVLNLHGTDLAAGAIITIAQDRVRIRPPRSE